MDERAIHIDFFMLAAVVFCGIDFWWSRRRGDRTPLVQRAVNALWRNSLGDFLQIVLLVVAVALLFPRDLEPNPKWPYYGRRHTLHQVMRALENYRNDYGAFPPRYVSDTNGRRMHSWRTSLLPYFEAGALYKIYQQNEPWDGPNNSKLKDAGVHFYYSSAGANNDGGYFKPSGLTHFLAVTGPGTALGTNPSNNSTGPTLMIVECPDSTVYWSEPRDLANPPTFPPRPRPWYSMRGERSYGRYALYSNGALEFFPDGVPTLRPPPYYPSRPSFRFLHWRWFLAAAELIALCCAAWQSFALLRPSRALAGAVLACAIVICVAPVLPPIVAILSPLALGVSLIICRRIGAFGIVVVAFYVWYLLIHVPPIHAVFAHTDGSVTEEMREVFLGLVPIAALPLLPSLGTNKPRIGFYTLILALACLQPLAQW
ncbi:MAG: DUF1559 domain-containing protein [Pirellulales bacterium]|nr:DUF1559 domain-containing protein [Pirellulales bacterium]